MTSLSHPHPPIPLFYSYSSLDKELRQQLERHLALLRNQGVIADWHDRQVDSGTEWEGQIHEHLNSAQVILLLVSSDFLASDYCYKIELKRAWSAMRRATRWSSRSSRGPAIRRNAPFARLQALPTDGQANRHVARSRRRVSQTWCRGSARAAAGLRTRE